MRRISRHGRGYIQIVILSEGEQLGPSDEGVLVYRGPKVI